MRLTDNVSVLITRRCNDVRNFLIRIEMWRCVFWIALRASVFEYFFALFLSKVTPIVHFDNGRLKAGLQAHMIVVTISRMLRCSSRSSVIGEQMATSAAAIGLMPWAIIWAA